MRRSVTGHSGNDPVADAGHAEALGTIPAPGTDPQLDRPVVGTVIRLSGRSASVDVSIDRDSPAARDLLGMLPLTLTLTEFNRRGKIADLPRPLDHRGTPGSDPQDGDLTLVSEKLGSPQVGSAWHPAVLAAALMHTECNRVESCAGQPNRDATVL